MPGTESQAQLEHQPPMGVEALEAQAEQREEAPEIAEATEANIQAAQAEIAQVVADARAVDMDDMPLAAEEVAALAELDGELEELREEVMEALEDKEIKGSNRERYEQDQQRFIEAYEQSKEKKEAIPFSFECRDSKGNIICIAQMDVQYISDEDSLAKKINARTHFDFVQVQNLAFSSQGNNVNIGEFTGVTETPIVTPIVTDEDIPFPDMFDPENNIIIMDKITNPFSFVLLFDELGHAKQYTEPKYKKLFEIASGTTRYANPYSYESDIQGVREILPQYVIKTDDHTELDKAVRRYKEARKKSDKVYYESSDIREPLEKETLDAFNNFNEITDESGINDTLALPLRTLEHDATTKAFRWFHLMRRKKDINFFVDMELPQKELDYLSETDDNEQDSHCVRDTFISYIEEVSETGQTNSFEWLDERMSRAYNASIKDMRTRYSKKGYSSYSTY